MNLAQARQQYPHLNDYSDEELLNIVAQSNNIQPGTPMYEQLEKQLLSHYERSWGEAAADTVRGLGQGLVGVGQAAVTLGGLATPMVNPYDNPVTNALG